MVDFERVKNAILYFAYKTNRERFGKTKLLKLLYLVDFLHVKRHGRPVFGDVYVHLEHGPIPSIIKHHLDDLEIKEKESGLRGTVEIRRRRLKTKKGEQHLVVPLKSESTIDLRYFSVSEKEILAEVAERWRDSTAREVEDFTHKEAAWKSTGENGTIDYFLAAQDGDCQIEPDVLRKCLEMYRTV